MLDVGERRGKSVGLLQHVRDAQMTSFHGTLPGELAVEWFVGSGAADKEKMDLVRVTTKRGYAQGLAQERGIGDSFGDLAMGWGARFEAAAEENFEAVAWVVVKGFFVGWVGTVLEEKFGEFAPARVGWFVGLAG